MTAPDRREPVSLLPQSAGVGRTVTRNGRLTYTKRAPGTAKCDKSPPNDTHQWGAQVSPPDKDIHDIRRDVGDTSKHAECGTAMTCRKLTMGGSECESTRTLAESGGGVLVVIGGVSESGGTTDSPVDTDSHSSGNTVPRNRAKLETPTADHSKEPVGKQQSLQLNKCHNRRLKLKTVFRSWPSTCSR